MEHFSETELKIKSGHKKNTMLGHGVRRGFRKKRKSFTDVRKDIQTFLLYLCYILFSEIRQQLLNFFLKKITAAYQYHSFFFRNLLLMFPLPCVKFLLSLQVSVKDISLLQFFPSIPVMKLRLHYHLF